MKRTSSEGKNDILYEKWTPPDEALSQQVYSEIDPKTNICTIRGPPEEVEKLRTSIIEILNKKGNNIPADSESIKLVI